MQSRLTLTLDTIERDALRELARFEYREIHQQAALIIRDELMRRGFLKSVCHPLNESETNKPITTTPPEVESDEAAAGESKKSKTGNVWSDGDEEKAK